MTYRSALESTEQRIHASHCKCKRCAPIRLSGDPANFGRSDTGFGRFLPDPPASVAMLIIGTVGLITHLILFS